MREILKVLYKNIILENQSVGGESTSLVEWCTGVGMNMNYDFMDFEFQISLF